MAMATSKPIRVLLTGSTGFVGMAVAAELRHRAGVHLCVTVRPGHNPAPRRGVEVRHADMRHLDSLASLVEGMGAVVHLATQIEGPKDELVAVNGSATRVIAEACTRAGVSRLVRLSTASIYGAGPWRGDDIHKLPPAPASDTSRSRLLGDQHVLEHGGCVVRPHLVWGLGDRWVLPRALQVTRAIGWVAGGRTLHSSIHIEQLAVLIADLALQPGARQGTILATDAPTDLRSLVEPALPPSLAATLPEISLADALAHRAGQHDKRWHHDVTMLGTDHLLSDSQVRPHPRRSSDHSPAI